MGGGRGEKMGTSIIASSVKMFLNVNKKYMLYCLRKISIRVQILLPIKNRKCIYFKIFNHFRGDRE